MNLFKRSFSKLVLTSILISAIGFCDGFFLTIEHFSNSIPPCSASILYSDCGTVLTSKFAVVFGIPLAVIGIAYYGALFLLLISSMFSTNRSIRYGAVLLPIGGFVASMYFVFLQLFVIHAICIFCFGSAIISTTLFVLTQIIFQTERKQLFISKFGFLYRHVAKPIFFQIDPEYVHNTMTNVGYIFGNIYPIKIVASYFLKYQNKQLSQTIANIHFANPIGLSAGFDYEAKLTQILPSIGFGFETVGTITYHPYKGNSRPMLGRLPKSQSLMVNKGFKNSGTAKTIRNLSELQFQIPLGISIGRTNGKDITQRQSVDDIVKSFVAFEKSIVTHTHYELNISCPNLHGNVSFYPPQNLEELLTTIDKLKLTRPLFIKMPIEKTDEETTQMLDVIVKHSPIGVIFGNLQKDRTNPTLDQSEVLKFPTGNFSGKPTYKRSNELITLSYKKYGKKLVIIGCGGIFNAHNAYEKITRGASLIQLITGMIFEGPQLISQVNIGLVELLKRDGFKNISEAVGSKNK